MVKLYHSLFVKLEVGSIVLPGNFGRIIRFQQGQGDAMLHRELAYETVRMCNFPEKPSRMEAIFACQGADSMIKFLVDYRQSAPTELIYEVEIADGEAPTHFAPINRVGPTATGNAWDGYMKNSFEYWAWDATRHEVPMEVVTTSPLRILSQGLSLNEFRLATQAHP